MAFQKPKKQPQFADLKGILAQTKETENPLYQTMSVLIDRLTQLKVVTVEEVADINNSVSNTKSIINIKANKEATYHTKEDEALELPNSVRLLAGSGVIFDDSVANQRTISSTGGGAGSSITVTREIPVGVIDGVNVTFTLAFVPIVGSEQVYLNGLLQDTRGFDYSISGAVITFFIPPVSGDRVLVTYQRI